MGLTLADYDQALKLAEVITKGKGESMVLAVDDERLYDEDDTPQTAYKVVAGVKGVVLILVQDVAKQTIRWMIEMSGGERAGRVPCVTCQQVPLARRCDQSVAGARVIAPCCMWGEVEATSATDSDSCSKLIQPFPRQFDMESRR